VVVVNPAAVRAFGKALGLRAKTDPIDARLIARFVATTRPEARPCPTRPPSASPTSSPAAARSSP
jgi:transposase